MFRQGPTIAAGAAPPAFCSISVTPVQPKEASKTGLLLLIVVLMEWTVPGMFGTLHSQSRTAALDSLLRKARVALARNQADSAEALFRAVLKADRQSLTAQIGLGRVEIAREEWPDAQSTFEDALEIDAANLEAHYYAGIAAREAGTQVALILRTARWNTAEEHFTFVLARDSLYRDVIFQLALLERYRNELDRALDLAYLQLAVTPGSPPAEIGLYHIYRYILAALSPTEALQILKARPTTESLYFSAELLRRVKQLNDAEKIVRQMMLSPAGVPVQAMLLTLARIEVERGDVDSAEHHYWEAVDRIGTSLGAALIFDDLKYIVTDAELDEYAALSSDKKKQAFFRSFWARRNPTPSAPQNPRLIEHYRRLLVAEAEFEYYGFRTPFNDPERFKTFTFPRSYALNREYNDKGQIWIRHGKPDVARRSINDAEVWVYFERGEDPQRVFAFSIRNSVGNNWRLVSFPDSPELIEELAIYDSRYRELLIAEPLARLGREGAVIQQSREQVQEALSTDRHTWREETVGLSVPGAVDEFRSEDGKTLLDISYGILLDEIGRGLPAGTDAAMIEVGVDISTPQGVRRTSRIDTLRLPVTHDFAGSYSGLFRSVVAPESLVVAVHVHPAGTSMLGGWQRRLRVRDFTGDGLMLSDLQLLLPSSREPAIEIDGVKVLQSPFDRVPRANPLMTYVHVYNLTQDVWGKTLYNVKYLLAPPNADPGEDEELLLEETLSGASPFEARFKMLDIRTVDAGSYTLIVQVTDTKRSRSVRAQRSLEVLD
jgi:tetratricopeptide (TPR) repeat protein